MRKINLILAIIGMALLNYSCNDEDKLTPSGQFIPTGLPFPQGDNPWDKDIVELHETYGVYVFYKDVTEALLNRDWTSVGTGDIYTGGDLSDDKVQFYVDFIKDDVFKYVNKELVTKTLPVRLYLLDNFRTRPRIEVDDNTDTGTGDTDTDTGTGGTDTDTGTGGTDTDTGTGGTDTDTGTGGTDTDTGTGGTDTDTGTGGTDTDTGTGGTDTTDPRFIPFYAEGFDYWALSFTDDEIQNLTHEARRLRSVPFIYQMLKKAVLNGIISNPESILEGVDTKTGFKNSDPNNPRHCFNRGFPENLSQDFKTSNKPWHPSVYFHPTDSEYYPHGDFLNLIRNNMWYSEDEIEAKYPQAKYPLLRKRLDLVYRHLLDNYGIDLKAIGAGSDAN